MFWLLKKIFWLAVIVGIVYLGAQYKIDGKPIKQYAKEFYESALVQAALKSGKEMAREFVDKKLADKPDQAEAKTTQAPEAADQLTEQDQKALTDVLEKEGK